MGYSRIPNKSMAASLRFTNDIHYVVGFIDVKTEYPKINYLLAR